MAGDGERFTDWEEATLDWDAETTVVVSVPTGLELVDHFDQHVVGHSHAKEVLAATLRLHWTRDVGRARPSSVLLMGPRGVGKTTLADTMLDATASPGIRIDFSELPEPTGIDLPSTLTRLGREDEARSPWGILFLDGLEQLAMQPCAATSWYELEQDLIRALNGHDLDLGGHRSISGQQVLICGAVTIEEPLRQTASQQELRAVLDTSFPDLARITSYFDTLVPTERLSAAQVARSFALSASPFARAKRVISSLGGSFHCDSNAVEALARTCAVSPVGAWAATRAIDRLLEQVLRSPDPKKAWRLGSA